MKLTVIFSVPVLLLLVMILSGCEDTTAVSSEETIAEKPAEIELVPARTEASPSSRKIVVEKDGKFYEMLEEHERLCHDCDR